MDEAERHSEYRRATSRLPPLSEPDDDIWVWSDQEIDILRKAFAARFGDTSRTEPLMMVAAAGIRIAKARMAMKSASIQQAWSGGAERSDCETHYNTTSQTPNQGSER